DIKLKNFHKEQSSKHRRSISYPDNLVQGFGFDDNIYKSIFFDVEPRLEQQILKPELNSLTENYTSNIYHQQTSHIPGLDAPWMITNSVNDLGFVNSKPFLLPEFSLFE
ncbi:hypothetical protein BB560_005608, partial [Smittium megazygosporum]